MSKTHQILNLINNRPFIIAGPCSIESYEQVVNTASLLSRLEIKLLRGGTFKPRTSPSSFQGLGEQGLNYMRKAADSYGMFVVSEVLETNQLLNYHEQIDMIQVGSRNMASYGFLQKVGEVTAPTGKPVLLKRGFSATLSELLSASQYIINEGNPNVLLCLRGIRTFEQIDSKFRFTPDLASIVELKERTDLPVVYDPSHATGNAKYIKKFSKAAIELGADGLIIESHYKPEEAKSDQAQCIHPTEVGEILEDINSPQYEF